MDFTREPIIETVIYAKDWHKLVIRNSKGIGQEEYFVDAVEVVSFGNSCFFRSMERSKSFLVPITDYEVVEVKETRMVLKNVGAERGTRGTPAQQSKAKEEETESLEERKRDKRRSRRRRDKDTKDVRATPQKEQASQQHSKMRKKTEGGDAEDETIVSSSSSVKKTLLPPPPSTLISETISNYKDAAISEKNATPRLEEESGYTVDELFSDKQAPDSEKKEPTYYEKDLFETPEPPSEKNDAINIKQNDEVTDDLIKSLYLPEETKKTEKDDG